MASEAYVKGTYVRVKPSEPFTFWSLPRRGWRTLNEEEQAQWYENFFTRHKMDRGHAISHKIVPIPHYVDLREDRIYEIIRARVVAPAAPFKIPKCCIIKDILTGEVLYARRDDLVAA